ncbi:hypothetical protein C900_05383 [Fulvivirga imtechensis AK7]|uniref:Uncharacterized protein n=1 Tax=Fulvivirga imtechensis AK7 TaxID=1237149 RepID=L8JP76_9BACT|nr:hypothetical protein [Fulvivirga imtechensis]ELR69187.1 hypothetical protein C900_05383 [Fulvivirga imtechensis AK7]
MNNGKTYLDGLAEFNPPEITEGYEMQTLKKQLEECERAIELAGNDMRVIRVSLAAIGSENIEGEYYDYFVEENVNVLRMLKAEQLVIKAQIAAINRKQDDSHHWSCPQATIYRHRTRLCAAITIDGNDHFTADVAYSEEKDIYTIGISRATLAPNTLQSTMQMLDQKGGEVTKLLTSKFELNSAL